MIAVSLNHGGGVRLTKSAKLYMCTQTLQTQRRRTHGAGCVRQWFRTAEPRGTSLGELEYTHTNVADEMDTALSVTSVGLTASGVGLLSTIIAAPVAIGLQAGAVVCGLLGADGKLVGRMLQAKARKHVLICGPGRVKAKHNRRPHFSCPERRQNYQRGISSDPL